MAKKAFVIGKNTKSLRWSEQDAILINEALTKLNYEVTKIEPNLKKSQIIEKFDDFIDSLAQTDTIIFYFSGHAYTPKGELMLVLDDDLQSAKSTLGAAYFTDKFTKCDAECKLIILDCCRANTVGKDWKPVFGNEKYRLLTASESLSQSKEVDGLSASLMTFFIHKALTEDLIDISDDDNHVRIEKLYKWIVEGIKQYDKDSRFPLPSLLGDQKINFGLATVKKTRLQLESQKNYIEKLWNKHESLIIDYKYWEGKLFRAEKINELDLITECRVNITTLIRQIENTRIEITGWQQELQKDKIEKVDLYENFESKLKDYSELPESDNKFVGREEIIKKVFERILSRKRIAVTGIKGMGGIGKTAITIEICNFIKESWEDNPIYPDYLQGVMGNEKHFEHGILWIRFEKKEPLKFLLTDKIAKQLGIKDTDDSTPDAILESIVRILKLKKYRNKILIILDSAEQNQNNFEKIFRAFNDLPVLVTTREQLDIDTININLLDIVESVELFKNHYLDDKSESLSASQIEQTENLCKDVGFLPLAIKILAKRAKHKNRSIDNILSDFRGKKLEILNAKILTEKEKKNEDAIICFMMSFDDENFNDLLKNIFMRCGLFYLPFKKQSITEAYPEKDISDELNELVNISLVDYDNERKKYSLHPLMREFALKNASDLGVLDDLYNWHKNNFLNLNLMDLPNGKELNDTIEEMFKTIEHFVCQKSEEANKIIIEFADKHYETLFRKGYWDRKIAILNIGINVCKKDGNTKKISEYYLQMGDCLGRQGKYDESIDFLNKSLEVKNEKDYYIYYSLIIKDYYKNNISKAFSDNFEFSRDALIYESEHVNSFIKTNAWIYKDYDYSIAETLAIVNLKKEKPNDLNYTGKTNFLKAVNDLIDIKIKKGLYQDSIKYCKNVLAFANEIQSSEDISTIISNLIRIYLKLKNSDEAKYYLKEYEILITEMGLLNGFRTIQKYKGEIEYLQRNFLSALSHFQHIEEQYEKDYWYGKTYLKISGEIENAEKYLNESLLYFKGNKDAVNIAKIYTQLALVEFKKETGKLLKAVEYISLAINTKKQYEIVDLDEEFEIRTIISSNDNSTYEFLEESFKEKYIDIQPDFIIKILESEIYVKDNENDFSKSMLLIPEGKCFVSNNDSDEIVIYNSDFILNNLSEFWKGFHTNRSQATELYLYPYYIDKQPVSNKEYKEFCVKTKRFLPDDWPSNVDEDFLTKPITNIAYNDAEAYAKWIGKELPTQAEWEKAISEKNIPFVNSDININDEYISRNFQEISKDCFSVVINNDEFLRFLVGDNIFTFINNNFNKGDNWSNYEEKDTIYKLGDFYDYSISIYNHLIPNLNESFKEKINWRRLFVLIAFSSGTGGIANKVKLLSKLSSLNENQLFKLYTIFVNEAIQIFTIQNKNQSIISDYLLQRDYWLSAIKEHLGIKSITDLVESNNFEFIAGMKTIENQNQIIKTRKIENDYKDESVGFRCVKPIYSNSDFQNFTIRTLK